MKILLISSGYTGIYPYLEKAIEDAFIFFDHKIAKINPEYTIATIEIIESFNPDLIMTFVGYKMDEKLMDFLKKRDTIRCIWLTEDPFYIDISIDLVTDYHYIFTIDLGAFEFYKKKFLEKNVYHLPLGTDPLLFHPSSTPSDYLYDLCLVGYPYPERIELVNQLLNHTQHTMILVGPQWKKFIVNHKQIRRITIINKWIDPVSVRNIYNLSKIILNPHRTANFHKNKNTLGIENKSMNNRTFDIAACGGFQLLPNKTDLKRHFNISQDIVVYSSFNECIQLVNQFINDQDSRNMYSRNARMRVVENHTFTHRVEFILKQVMWNENCKESGEKI